LLRVDPERRFFTPPSKAGLGAAEWVNPKPSWGQVLETFTVHGGEFLWRIGTLNLLKICAEKLT